MTRAFLAAAIALVTACAPTHAVLAPRIEDAPRDARLAGPDAWQVTADDAGTDAWITPPDSPRVTFTVCEDVLRSEGSGTCSFEGTCSVRTVCCEARAACVDGVATLARDCTPGCCAGDTECVDPARCDRTLNRCTCPPLAPECACGPGFTNPVREGCPVCECVPAECREVGTPCALGVCRTGLACRTGCTTTGCCAPSCVPRLCPTPEANPEGCRARCPAGAGCRECRATACRCTSSGWACDSLCGAPLGVCSYDGPGT